MYRCGSSEGGFPTRRSSAIGVRRAKAALSSGCKPHPAIAPAGSNRSSHGGNEVAENQEEQVHGQEEDASQAPCSKAEGNPRRDEAPHACSAVGVHLGVRIRPNLLHLTMPAPAL